MGGGGNTIIDADGKGARILFCDKCGSNIQNREALYCPQCGKQLFAGSNEGQKNHRSFSGLSSPVKVALMMVILVAVLSGFAVYYWQGQNQLQTQPQRQPSQAEQTKIVVSKCDYKEGKLDVTYPHIEGMTNKVAQDKMNDLIKKRADNFIDNMKKMLDIGKNDKNMAKMEYGVNLMKDDLLSLTISTFSYTGGAHGSSIIEGYTFDLATGDLIRFSDKFKFDTKSRQVINEQITQQIHDRNIAIFQPFKGVGDNPNYYLKEGNKMVIVFQEYEIAPFSSGILQFELPYSELLK